ncbi:SpoIIE family protein phosphatase [Streptomyces sp. NBC_00536]|uniref:SpoIIE family protein phosphatase n=1 Tax=Streptomyces sp. NBC_00536 TaxID=2975769 RepID=UPI002E821060|nr:SpoIIE family protein phosphatase [Streptomyces sp. NBC_00536]WUC79996.1 SpoIIE family protein phosphatase [Streptomyces sp. NBC_00536]
MSRDANTDDALAAAVSALTAEIAGLHDDRARRRLLDLATGVLVDQLRVTPAEAADHLLELAVSTGLSAGDLAADILNAAAKSLVAEAPADARRIRRATAAVLATDTAGEAAVTLLDGGLRRIGVRTLYLWRRTGTDCLALAGQAGAGPQEARHWQWVPPDTPLHRVLWEGAAWWGVDDWLPGGTGTRAVLPLRRHGHIVGVALCVWDTAQAPDDRVRRTAELLCEPCGALLGEPDPPGTRAAEAVLLELATGPAVLLGADGRLEYVNPAARTALGAVRSPVGRSAAEVFPYAWSALAPAADRTEPRRLGHVGGLDDVRVLPLGRGRAAVLWEAAALRSEALTRVLGRLERVGYFEEDLLTGATRWSQETYTLFGMDRDAPPVPLARLGARLHPEDVPLLEGLLASLGEGRRGDRALVRAIRADGGVRHVRIAAEPLLSGAALTGLTGVYQDVSAQHHNELALSAAQEDATARARFVLQLQRAIVPEAPLTAEPAGGLDVAVRYRPASQDYLVGGDWYDVLVLPDGRVLVAVGDIAGHGIDAATSMVVLRNALRGLAVTGAGPGRLMTWLNEVTLGTRGGPTATAVCAVYDPVAGSLRWAGAGHPPVLLLREGRARILDAPHNILLGAVAGADYEEASLALLPGDTLLLYTDGFVERRHVSMDRSLAALRRAAQRVGAGPVESMADALLSAVTGDTDDDTSLVVVRVPRTGAGPGVAAGPVAAGPHPGVREP